MNALQIRMRERLGINVIAPSTVAAPKIHQPLPEERLNRREKWMTLREAREIIVHKDELPDWKPLLDSPSIQAKRVLDKVNRHYNYRLSIV